jgi:hypothetical protein
MYENRTMKPTEIVLRRGEGRIKEKYGRGKSTYIINIYVNVTMYLLYNYNMIIINIFKNKDIQTEVSQ